MTLAQVLAYAGQTGLEPLDAQLLLLHVLGRRHDRAWLYAHDRDPLPAAKETEFKALCARRQAGEPVAYLIGEKEFFGLSLQVDRRVLVPRPDTETLVHWALELALPADTRVIDLGTGSGAIALALKHERPQWRLSALDASPEALQVARANGQALNLSVDWCQGHWLAESAGPFDLIVSNPPYIADGDEHLPALAHEPRSALTAGAQGLDDLRVIINQAPSRLAAGGWLLLEHGHDQAGAVRDLMRRAGLMSVQSRRDLAGIERCSGGQKATTCPKAPGDMEQD